MATAFRSKFAACLTAAALAFSAGGKAFAGDAPPASSSEGTPYVQKLESRVTSGLRAKGPTRSNLLVNDTSSRKSFASAQTPGIKNVAAL